MALLTQERENIMNTETTPLHAVSNPVGIGEVNLATQNQTDYTVYSDGSAYISQRKAAELIGVNANTLMSHISRAHSETATGLGLDPKTLQMATTYFAYDSSVKSEKARALCARMMEAGAKAFIYHEAGYKMAAAKPLSAIQLTLQIATNMAEQERRILANTAKIEEIEARQKLMDGSTGYKTVVSYCRDKGIGAPLYKAIAVGKACSALCREHSVDIGKVPDERWGEVNSYPIYVLDEYFNSLIQ